MLEFLSARPVRAATCRPSAADPELDVSIRATRAGRDAHAEAASDQVGVFLSARPVRAATYQLGGEWMPYQFLSARPVRAATFSNY